MYIPKERVRHELPEGGWPTAEEAARSRWFSPIALGPVTLRQRTWVPAMVPWRATEDGQVTKDVLDWYARFAKGKPGAIVVEATGIRDIPSGPLLRIGHDRFTEGLQTLVDRVREASEGETRLFIQLIDFLAVRRRPEKEKFFRRFLAITDRHRELLPDTDIREHLCQASEEEIARVLQPRELEDYRYGYRERVTDLHLEHIRTLPETMPPLFAQAAKRAQEAGFDGVELHYAHAYTMASFLSKLNDRTDGYGGPRENRIKVPLETYHAVRQAVGPQFAVGCRFLTRDIVPGGSTVEDAAWFGGEFAKAGMDFLSLSRGGRFEDAKQPPVGWAVYPYTGPSGFECMPTALADARGPFSRNAEDAGVVRRAAQGVPVIVSGGICSFTQAESILERGLADVVASARQSLADPDWFLKVREGRGEDVRRCIFSNYCEGLDNKHKQVTCQLWDRLELDAPDVTLSSDGKRRLVAP